MGDHIVCGIDASPEGPGAAALAARLARDLACSAILAHVQPHPDPVRQAGVVSIGYARELGRLRATVEEHDFPAGAIPRLATGDTAQELVRIARTYDSQLLVVGSGGRGELGTALLGSVSSTLMRIAPCPVLVAPPGCTVPEATAPLGPIVCGVEGSERDPELLRLAGDLGGRLGVPVHAVHAFAQTPPEVGESAGATLRRAIRRARIRAREWVVEASAGAGLRQVAERTGAGFIAVASKGRGRLGPLLHGSLAVRIAAEARCPVIVLPPGAELGAGTGHYELPSAA